MQNLIIIRLQVPDLGKSIFKGFPYVQIFPENVKCPFLIPLFRKALSPTFSSGKIKGMLDLLGGCVDNMIEHLEEVTKKSNSVKVKTMFQCMALDIIAKCGFGIESNSFKDQDNEVFKNGKDAFADFICKDFTTSVILNVLGSHPIFMKYLDIVPPGNYFVFPSFISYVFFLSI